MDLIFGFRGRENPIYLNIDIGFCSAKPCFERLKLGVRTYEEYNSYLNEIAAHPSMMFTFTKSVASLPH
jgi:hypothetical protein